MLRARVLHLTISRTALGARTQPLYTALQGCSFTCSGHSIDYYKGVFIKYGFGGSEDFEGVAPIFAQALKGGGRSVFRKVGRGAA